MVSSISPAVLAFIGMTAFIAASGLPSARPRRILQVTHNQQ
jgi:ABC-type phosphate transport system auxiliary subunit